MKYAFADAVSDDTKLSSPLKRNSSSQPVSHEGDSVVVHVNEMVADAETIQDAGANTQGGATAENENVGASAAADDSAAPGYRTWSPCRGSVTTMVGGYSHVSSQQALR